MLGLPEVKVLKARAEGGLLYAVYVAKVVLVLVSVFFTSVSWAQPVSSAVARQAIMPYMPLDCVFTGQFSQVKTTKILTLNSSGTFFYNCDYGLVWQSLKPFVETALYKKNAQHALISALGDTQKLSGRAQKGLAKFLLRLMSGDTDYFIKAFNIENIGTGLRLHPKSRFMKKRISDIILESEGGARNDNLFTVSTTINLVNGDVTSVRMHHLKTLRPSNKTEQRAFCNNAVNDQADVCRLLERKKNNVYKR